MQLLLIIAIALHVLSSTFWAGSTFVLARTGGTEVWRLFRPQMAAATVAVGTGVLLWKLAHIGGAGTNELLLGVGAAAAVTALAVQALGAGRALRAAARDESEPAVAAPYRLSAGLLMLTLICMAAARYA